MLFNNLENLHPIPICVDVSMSTASKILCKLFPHPHP
jgi:hypothetical protein